MSDYTNPAPENEALSDSEAEKSLSPPSPFAKYTGFLQLGNKEIECYVLDTDDRVISMRATVRAISNADTGNLTNLVSVKSIQPYFTNSDLSEKVIDFSIPGIPGKGKGLSAETFLDICSAYVAAAADPQIKLTAKQTEIATNCAVIISACAKTGLIALIDEATGYQYERAEDALRVKVQAFISEELRAWEKTFPDELWEQFGRLTHWKGSLHQRPKYWGKLVMELVYDALDPDVAKYLRENKPKPKTGISYHQWLTEDYGVRTLTTHINEIIGIAKTCDTLQELKDKVAYVYNKKPMQITIDYYIKDNSTRRK